jgi:hypothetical protein
MKKIYLIYLFILTLTGCSQMIDEQNRKNQNEVDNIVNDCPVQSTISQLDNKTEGAFAEKLDFTAFQIEQIRKTNYLKYQTLMLYMGTLDITNAMKKLSQCEVSQEMPIIESVKKDFESMKLLTKNPQKKSALVDAYSSWQTFISSDKSESIRAKYEMENAINRYKNI